MFRFYNYINSNNYYKIDYLISENEKLNKEVKKIKKKNIIFKNNYYNTIKTVETINFNINILKEDINMLKLKNINDYKVLDDYVVNMLKQNNNILKQDIKIILMKNIDYEDKNDENHECESSCEAPCETPCEAPCETPCETYEYKILDKIPDKDEDDEFVQIY
jgi:hypothetical protein